MQVRCSPGAYEQVARKLALDWIRQQDRPARAAAGMHARAAPRRAGTALHYECLYTTAHIMRAE